MAIAFDAAGTATQALSTSVTFSHTCSGSDRILFVNAAAAFSSSGTVTGVTYNGVAMTLVDSNLPQANSYTSLWYLVAPSTGANNVVITSSSGAVLTTGGSISYTGVSQTGVPDSTAKNSGVASNLSQSVTTVADKCWVVGACVTGNSTITAGTGITSRSELDSVNGSTLIGDSNGLVTPAGSYSMLFSTTSADSMSLIMASFKPTGSGITVSETITLSDVSIKATSRHFLETILLSDTVSKVLVLIKSVTEVIVLTAFDTLKITGKMVSESITLADSFVRSIGRRIVETITLSDFVTRGLFITRQFTEAINLSEQISFIKNFTKRIVEQVTLSETFAFIKNGIVVSFRNVAKYIDKVVAGVNKYIDKP